jgi:sugar phosphate isomerase/epimerase
MLGATARREDHFVVASNSYPCAADFAQFLDQVSNTSIHSVEMPVGADGSKSLIPELMVDVPLGGKWQRSLPDLKQFLARKGLRIECLGMAGNMGYPGSERMILRRIDFAEHLGVKTLNIACDPGVADKHREFAYSMLRQVGQYAAKKGIRIALETWGGITRNAEECLRTMREVGLANVGINVDTGNVLIHNRDLAGSELPGELKQLARHVVYVHLKDVRRTPDGKSVTTVLGQGEIDFRPVFDVLHAAGFYGPFGFDLETTRSIQSHDVRECHKDLLESIEYLRSLGELDA